MIENTKAVVLNIKQQILHLLLVMRKLEKDLANTKVETFRKKKKHLKSWLPPKPLATKSSPCIINGSIPSSLPTVRTSYSNLKSGKRLPSRYLLAQSQQSKHETMCEICSKSTIKKSEWRHDITDVVLLFRLLTLINLLQPGVAYLPTENIRKTWISRFSNVSRG